MEDIQDVIIDPYSNIKISLIVSSKGFDDFLKLYNNLISSSKNTKNVEMLVKIDDLDNRYSDLLLNSSFAFKILSYPAYYKRYSNHIFFNDLCKLSYGKLIWPIYEDCNIIHGDWYESLIKFIDKKYYKDNIFNIAIPMDNGKSYKQICGANIITREWYNFFGIISPFPNLDRWLSELSRKINRYAHFEECELLSSFPKGHRTLSKQQRKDLFYPMMKNEVKKFEALNK